MPIQSQRPRFYESQYLGADDMNAVVEYGHTSLTRHELGPHTWGIVVGLYLVERSTPGAPERRLVTLMPGMAIDGFARTITVGKHERLPESLFVGVAYDANVDDPALTSGKPPGRFVQVWLEYRETNAKSPAPGFERCDASDEFARVEETYRFVIGDVPALADRRSPITIAGQAFDAAHALQRFDPSAPVLEDASIPHQQLPSDNSRARWLVPIGVVRWVAYAGGGGYFVDRNIDAADTGDARARKLRRFAGLACETIHASDGSIVLRDRGVSSSGLGRYATRLASSDAVEETKKDLVWVEGNLRVVGDERLAGGALRFTDVSGKDQGTPLSIERAGDKAGVTGARAIDALIGPDAQKTNRFAVATVVADDPDPSRRTLSEKLSVLSGGNVGVGTDTPQTKLHVKGPRFRLEDEAASKSLDLRTDGSQVDVETRTSDLFLRSAPLSPPKHIVMNPDAADGNVGVGTAGPTHKLHVASNSGIRQNALYLSGGIDWASLTYNGFHNAANSGWEFPDRSRKTVTIELDDSGGKSRFEVWSNALGQAGAWRSHFKVMGDTDTTIMAYDGGMVGVGTANPQAKLSVVGVRADHGKLDVFAPTADFEYDGGTDGLFVFKDNGGRTAFMGGNVGIGTTNPGQKLHVAGSFLRVDGAANEQAYIGGDGSGFTPFRSGDVQIGSFNVQVSEVHLWNTAYGGWMNLHCSALIEESDRQSKQNIEPIQDALATVEKLRGVSFQWADNRPGAAGKPTLGVIAQEVEAVLPQVVERRRGLAGVSYTKLVPLLIEAIKELKAENAALQGGLEDLRAEVFALVERKPKPAPGHSNKKKP